MGDVVRLVREVPEDTSCGFKPQDGVIARLEGLLAQAKTGAIQSLAVAYIRANGTAGYATSYGQRDADHFDMSVALRLLNHMYDDELVAMMCDPEHPTDEPGGSDNHDSDEAG